MTEVYPPLSQEAVTYTARNWHPSRANPGRLIEPAPLPKPAPWPEPRQAARTALSSEVPASAAAMAVAAFSAGWSVDIRRAVGTLPHRAHWTPLRVVSTVAVRMDYRALRAVGEWMDGKFAGGWFWSIVELPRRVNHDELLAMVKRYGS